MTDDLVDGLAAVLGGAEITGLTRLSGGASRETWRFEADGRPLILQRQRDGDVRDMATEVAAVRAAASPAFRRRPSSRRRPITPTSGRLHDPGAGRRRDDASQDPARRASTSTPDGRCPVSSPTRSPGSTPSIRRNIPGLVDTDQVEQYREVLDTLGQPHPTFELAFRWLDANRPPSVGTVVVHGDFRLGNVIVDDDGLRAVLDWELVHLGDPMEDLGWLCVKAWRFGSPKPVAGVAGYEELFAAYEAAGGGAGRRRRRPLVGGARHVEMGDHVHHAGQRASHRRDPQP